MMGFVENATYEELDQLERGHEVIYRGIRTQVIWTIEKPEHTIFVVLQNGAVLSMARGEAKPVRTFPAFGENTLLTF